MRCADICARLDDRLRTDDYADVDASANGLQVGPPDRPVDRVAFAVDAAVETIERTAAFDADLFVTHHGISWGGFERVTDRHYRRIAPLIETDTSLYVSHLPLDGHQELGNAAGLAERLDLEDREPFGTVGGEPIGQRGSAVERYTVETLRERLTAELDHGGQGVQVLDFGPEEIEEIAILTGSGVDWLEDAADLGVDAFVTGEGKQQAYHQARERNLNVFLAGHYATETFGVRALQELVETWGPETQFIDEPTGL